eukprot:673107_1
MHCGSCHLACLQLAIVVSFNFGVMWSITYNSAFIISPLSYIMWSAATVESTSPPTLPPFSLFSSDQAVIIWNDDMETNDGWQTRGGVELPSSERHSCCNYPTGRCAYLDALQGYVSITKTTNITAYKSIQFAIDILYIGSASSTGHFSLEYKYDDNGWIEYKQFGMDVDKQWNFDQIINFDLPVSTQLLTIRISSAGTKGAYLSRCWLDNAILIGIPVSTAVPSQTPTTDPSRTPTAFPSQTPTTFPSRTPTTSPSRTPTFLTQTPSKDILLVSTTSNVTHITTLAHQTSDKDDALSIAIIIALIVACLAVIVWIVAIVCMVKKHGKTHRVTMDEMHHVVACTDEMEREREIMISWLRNTVGLEQYIAFFLECGYESMRMVQKIEDRQDLIDMGIIKVAHQILLLKAIGKIQNADFNINMTTRQHLASVYIDAADGEQDEESSVHSLYVVKHPTRNTSITTAGTADANQIRSRISNSSYVHEGVNAMGYTHEGPNDTENKAVQKEPGIGLIGSIDTAHYIQ